MSAHPLPWPRTTQVAVAALSPLAIGGILAARVAAPAPLVTVPAIVFGVLAATGPALYIATAATGQAPTLAAMLRAFGVALAAFGIVLAALVLPAAFLALSSVEPATTVAVTSAALAGAAVIGLRRLSRELGIARSAAWTVFAVWSVATIGIAGRLWWDVAQGALS